MENRTILIEQKIKNIQSDYQSEDYEKAKIFHDYMMPKVEQAARELGSTNLPVNSEYEQMLIARYNSLYTELISDETAMAEELRTSFNQTREDYFNTNEGHANYEITRIKQEFEKAKILFGRPLGETNAVIFLLRKTWLVYILVAILGALELPLNRIAFNPLSIGSAGTIMLALLLVLMTPILSHMCGRFIKQSEESRSNKILGISIGIVLVIITLFLSYLRFMYFAVKGIESDFDSFQEAYQNFKFSPGVLIRSSIFWTSFILNLALILTGFSLGYLSHDSRDAFEKAYKLFTFRRPMLISQLSKGRKNQYTNYTIQGENALTREQRLQKEMIQYRRMHEALAKHITNFGDYMDGLCKEAINSFRLHNQAARKDTHSIPRHWRDELISLVAVTPKKITPIFVETYAEMTPHVAES